MFCNSTITDLFLFVFTQLILHYLTFWNEINRLYAQRSVTVPVFGAGITRFKKGFEDIDIDELLRIMIWTFKISKIRFAYPAKLTIIVHDDLLSKVNLYELRENE